MVHVAVELTLLIAMKSNVTPLHSISASSFSALASLGSFLRSEPILALRNFCQKQQQNIHVHVFNNKRLHCNGQRMSTANAVYAMLLIKAVSPAMLSTCDTSYAHFTLVLLVVSMIYKAAAYIQVWI